MSKHYDEVWGLIEKLDDINAMLSDMLDVERDRHARPHLQAAIPHIEDAVEELEDVDPDRNLVDSLRTGNIVIGKLL